MYVVNIYLETSIKGPVVREGWYAFTLEYITKQKKAVIREDYTREKELTYHKSVLRALMKALKRLNSSCSLIIYTDSEFLKNMVETNLENWKRNGFLNAQGEPVKNQEEWKEIARLLSGHKVEFRITSKHLYSVVMKNKAEEMKKNVEKTECERIVR